MKSFASDNFSGAHPEVLNALVKANHEHEKSYGADAYTQRAEAIIRKLLKDDAAVFFVFNGTAANVLSLKALVPCFGAVICARTAHINVDECGAPEANIGCKLLAVDTPDGKLRPDLIHNLMHHKGNEHHAQPLAISISQPTELGTLYSLAELRELVNWAHSKGLRVHVDGARIANAVAAMGCSLREMIVDTKVDALSFGGTKNGIIFGEAVVFLDPLLASSMAYLRKQSMQLMSKMRFVGAQFCALLENDLWLQNASHANAMAERLEKYMFKSAALVPVWQRQTNALFVKLPPQRIVELQKLKFFYVWDEGAGIVRWMTSWDTTEAEIEEFADSLYLARI